MNAVLVEMLVPKLNHIAVDLPLPNNTMGQKTKRKL